MLIVKSFGIVIFLLVVLGFVFADKDDYEYEDK